MVVRIPLEDVIGVRVPARQPIMNNTEEALKSSSAEKSFDPKGHPPLVFVENNLFRTPKGDLVRPEWPIGPKSYHRELFIEYERTFGRGMAKDISHDLGFSKIPFSLKSQINILQQEYRDIAGRIGYLSFSGSEEDVKREIQKIKEYRSKFPELYEDVDRMEKPKVEIKFETK